MKKLFSTVLCICIMMSLVPFAVQAGDSGEPVTLKDANFYVEQPVVGEKPSTVVTTDREDVFKISNVKWTGITSGTGSGQFSPSARRGLTAIYSSP